MFFFKSKAEREKERLERDIEKTERKIQTDKEISELEKRRKELDQKKARHDERSFHDKVFDTNVMLNQLEKEFTTNIFSEINDIKDLQAKNRSTTKAKARLKNSYLSLVMVKHAKNRMVEIQSERDWNIAMKDLGGAIKTMNSVSEGSNIIQKFLFRTRVKKMGWLEDNESGGWFNKNTEQQVTEDELRTVMNSDPIDLLVADDVYDTLLEKPSVSTIDDFAERSVGVDSTFEEVAGMSKAAGKQENVQSTQPAYTAEDTFTDEELEESLKSWGNPF